MNPAQKLVAGALLVGVGILSGDATVLTVTGGVGVNWTADGLAGLWDRVIPLPASGSPLSHAYQRAIEKSVRQLRSDYIAEAGASADTKAFDLVAASAADLSAVEYSATERTLPAAEENLALGLGELLFGHDPRAVNLLQQSLMPTVARALRVELTSDDKAWRQFHGDLIERLAQNSERLGANQVQVADALARFQDADTALRAWNDNVSRLESLIAELNERRAAPPPSGEILNFNNQGANIGTLNQGQTVYIRSAHAEGGGNATVHNDET